MTQFRPWTTEPERLSLEEVVAAQPTSEFDKRLGGGFIPPARLGGSIYDSL